MNTLSSVTPKQPKSIYVLFLLGLVFAWAAVYRADGSEGRGAAAREGRSLRMEEQDGLRVLWKRKLGTGYSGIAVAGRHAITMYGDGKYDYVISLHPHDGREQWRHRIGPTFRAPIQSNDGPVSTPVVGRDLVYALTPKGSLLALDLETGRPKWSHDLVAEYGAPSQYFGFAMLPVLTERLLLVEVGGAKGSLLAFAAKTGKFVWAAGDDTVTYQSPVLTEILNERQVVFAGDRFVYGVNPETGEVRWKHEHGVGADPDVVKQILLGPGNLNPIFVVPVGDDKLLLTNYYNPTGVMLKLSRGATGFTIKEVWRNGNLRKSYAVPVAVGNNVCGYNSRFATCLDAESGAVAWKSRAPGDGWIIETGGYLVFLTKDEGSVHVARASNSAYEELASTTVFENLTWTPPTYYDGLIFARNFSEVAAISVVRGARMNSRRAIDVDSGSSFGRFITSARAAAPEQRRQIVEAYLAQQKSFPIIEGRTAHIVFRGKVQDVAVEGDMLEAGEQAAMTRLEGTDFYFASFQLEPDARVDYRISKDYKSAVVPDPLNPRRVALPGGEYSELAMPGWTRPAYLEAGVARQHGTIKELDFNSSQLPRRAIRVYVPSGYEQSSNRYPVLYVANGGQADKFGLITSTLDILISNQQIRPLIAVLIDSNSFDEFAGNLRDQHAEMIVRELVPLIDRSYRTLAVPSERAFMGADAAGYAGFYSAFKFPGTFGMVAGQSTYLFNPVGGEQLRRLVNATPRFAARFYLSWGTYDLRGRGVQRRRGMMDWRKDNQDFLELLRTRGFAVTGEQFNEGWGWSSWRNYTGRILEHFFKPGPKELSHRGN
jgi:enterochelin esterase-like enzyme/outer membrane protein assembly factor BamB